ncbi:D-alanyl-D-alanine carboxypeptidase [Candidatus Peregrinibacteria bacterium]|jgi:serine-type D-Ala-D-Ala carboxypeptidase (penicillin-binding protein 5/6)|nr:D-alanyl-D-alanine carboxypeptidase [Candidatus Peregrinibacteria bacterium]MBT3598487.1 D-alanyl-D-alanine carboxypeptidase [Candidatus Peregrinibacteria bacterium]MBT4367171.1 D-alanyl-D-alanine carboxypeptidase [Candidatus Peregrinibacteria bacterium]MBT6730510.1 D-alanyl-D-alanine carboxypeptidase [Candidatus Peregrinibacteria bacterium]MBT7009380.1 D-alanyl-D-alanine carboxypeptidase [Candidatus Peregrinibacteria bacterium]
MYQSLLSVLLMGMVPTLFSPLSIQEQTPISLISISEPSMEKIIIEDRLSASGVIIMDLNSGQNLYEKQAVVRRPMASLTKLMTALLIVENHDMDEIVTIPDWATEIDGNVASLKPGNKFRVGDLLSALLISSANDAAQVLAAFHAGSVSDFVDQMNERAIQLGLKETSFANPSGLDHPRQWSTPRDIAWLSGFAIQKEPISDLMHIKWKRIKSQEGTVIPLSHTHAMLHTTSPVVAGKTGTTNAAGQCLVSVVENEGHSYIVVILNSRNRYADMKTILKLLVPEEEVIAGVS